MDNERALGEIFASISISTAVSLEKLMESGAYKAYSHIYINVSTLFRNYLGSFKVDKTNDYNKKELDDFKKGFLDEIISINSIIINTISTRMHPVFYVCNYRSFERIFIDAKVRKPTTNKQIMYENIHNNVVTDTVIKLNSLFDPKNDEDEPFIKEYDVAVKGNNTTSLILTHMPLDLLNNSSFRKLMLLESHTGAIKQKTEWISKINKNEEAINIPFNILSIQIFGDNNLKLHSLDKPTVTAFIEVSKKGKWYSGVTMAKVIFDIRNMKDKALSEKLLRMSMVQLK